MSDQTTKNPRIKQGWLRIILFGIGFLIITLLIAIPAGILLVGVNLDSIRADPSHALANILSSGTFPWFIIILEALVAGITVTVFWKFIDRRPFDRLGFGLGGFATEAFSGLFIGPTLLGLCALLLMLTGHLSWVDITFDPTSLFISLGLMLLVAFSEEIVFRGYILTNLLDIFAGNKKGQPDADISPARKWIALGVSALLFAIFHLGNPGINTMALINLLLAGILLGINYIYTRNLWFSILFHFSWNFFQGPVLGFRVSGLNLPSLLQIETKGDMMITGGDFGLEGSVLNTLISFIAIFVLAWAFERKYNSGNAAAMA